VCAGAERMYDTIIIGGGPSAMSASVYAARQNLKFIVIAEAVGGQMAWSSDVRNYPGFGSISGIGLARAFEKQAVSNGAKIILGRVESIKKRKDFFVVSAGKDYEARTVLIASGKKPRKLNIEGEEKYSGKGVFYCAVCDGPVFSGRVVAVIGGGNSAMDAALLLAGYAKKVFILTIKSALFGESGLLNGVLKSKKIKVIYNAEAKSFFGGALLEGIKYGESGVEKSLKAEGVFIEVGSEPAVGFDKLTKKNRWGEIIIHENEGISNMASVKGIFAAGDATSVPEKQVIVAAGEGVKAILGIIKYLNKNNKN
jgi:thioredoxin reductase